MSAASHERVRLAIEELLSAAAPTLAASIDDGPDPLARRHLGLAATRMIMRLLVMLLAEARGLLPGQHLHALRAGLEPGAAGDRVTAWPTILAQMHALDRGPLPGEATDDDDQLFAPGRVDHSPLSQAMHALEDPRSHPSDAAVSRLLALLPPSAALATVAPATIGEIYERLLDHALQRDEAGAWVLRPADGRRKGGGRFYTPPALAEATVRQCLRPLTHDAVAETLDPATGLTEVEAWRPRPPESILALTICDPAMGPGSFLLATLQWLTDALAESVQVHGRIARRGDATIVRLGPAEPETLTPTLTPDHQDFATLLRARLRRRAARCLYGVDIDPTAVALARSILWLEVADPSLPPDAFAHALRCGDALVGAWSEQVGDYPIAAWAREGGDKNHHNFVHHYREVPGRDGQAAGRRGDRWTHALRQKRAALTGARIEADGGDLDDEAAPACDSQERFDAWCALWFWPGDALDEAPTPQRFARPGAAARRRVAALRREHRFFHWELAFPAVFAGPEPGFDAIVGNPPWDVQKPNSKEFFAAVDPGYRGLGKQEALRWQARQFAASPALERRWIAHQARLEALANWVSAAARPVADPRRAHRPFRHQGAADLNSYKLFVEQAHALLRTGGRLGLVVPSGLYTDKGTAPLRTLLLERCTWEWLFAFENRDEIFAIHRAYKFAAIVVAKGGTTTAIRAAFMRRDLGEWNRPRPPALAYPRARIDEFSPGSRAILEIGRQRDLEVLHALHGGGVRLGDDGEAGWGVVYTREFDMTNDSHRFAPRPQWERRGYLADEHGHWIAGAWAPYHGPREVLARPPELLLARDGRQAIAIADIADVAVPLYEGRMIGQFDASEKGWVGGKGRAAVWRDIPWQDKVLEPQFLLSLSPTDAAAIAGPKLGFMSIGSATNRRSAIACFLDGLPAGNSLGILRVQLDDADEARLRTLALTGVLNSFAYDFMLRARLGGVNVNRFILDETALPALATVRARERPATVRARERERLQRAVAKLSAALGLVSLRFAPTALWARKQGLAGPEWRRGWALTAAARLRLRAMLDALIARWYGLRTDDFCELMRDCDWPTPPAHADPKGFWRIDKDRPPELRHTVLAQVAFHDLQRDGQARFLEQRDGRGWPLPETLRLADYGLGHDDRARQPQPVATVLAPRADPRAHDHDHDHDSDWLACERHAALLERVLPWTGARGA